MTQDQEARVIDGLVEALNYPAYVSPPPLPKRSAVPSGRVLLWVGLLLLSVAGAFGAYVYSQVVKVDRIEARGLKLWDKTEDLMTQFGVAPPASCLQARSDAATLRSYAADKFGNLEKRLVAMKALAEDAPHCMRELEKAQPEQRR